MQVLVRDNNVDQALRFLKKKLQREGVFREMRLRKAYEKPSEKRVREKAEAVRRARKLARKQAIREGLIAAPKRPARPDPRKRGGLRPGLPRLLARRRVHQRVRRRRRRADHIVGRTLRSGLHFRVETSAGLVLEGQPDCLRLMPNSASSR